MMPKVSVIIPVYNAEKYLRECIDSVLAQTFDDFELLLINDGSTDGSGKICDEYAKKDKRIKVFHKENGGVSSARNLGLDNAKGEWITFVDSDDKVIEMYLYNLYKDVENCDIVFQGIIKKKFNTKEEIQMIFYDEVINIKDFLQNHMITSYGFAVAKLFSFSIIKKNRIEFDECINFAEDALFLIDYLCFVENIMLSSNKGYYYYERENSLVKQKYSYKKEVELLRKADGRINELFLKNAINTNSNEKYKELQYYLTRVIFAITKMTDSKQRRTNFKNLLTIYESEFLYLYRNSKFRGRLIYYFVKYKQIRLLDYLLSIIYKTN